MLFRSIDESQLPKGYVPVGAKEYGGIVYLALLNPETNDCEIGSIPSPNFNVDANLKDKDGILIEFTATSDNKGNDNYSKLIKFFERDLLEINPGDRFKLSRSNKGPVLYEYNYKIFDTNENMYDLEIDDTKVGTTTGSSQFQYFNHTVSSVMGLEIKLNNIDYFDAYCIFNNNENNLSISYFYENKL